jgi:hypothetical protein
MTLELTAYDGSQTVAEIFEENEGILDFVKMKVKWGVDNPSPYTAPVLLLITDLTFVDTETNEHTKFRSVMSAPFIEAEPGP